MALGMHKEDSNDIADFAVDDRKILRLPVTGVTRDGNNRISQIVYSGVNPANGITYTKTSVITRDGAGRATTIANTFTGGGVSRTETWTVNRDGNNRVTTVPVART
jgi:hypothetical protein